MEGYVAEIRLFAGDFVPANWALCDGSLLSIRDNIVLFSFIGTTYGGDGLQNFALPDLRGRIVVGTGPVDGLSDYNLAKAAGMDQVPTVPVQASVDGGQSTTVNSVVPASG